MTADEPENLAFLVGKGWASMRKAAKLSDVDVSEYDAVFTPGGLAPMVDMPEHPLLKQVIRVTFERRAVVGGAGLGPAHRPHAPRADFGGGAPGTIPTPAESPATHEGPTPASQLPAHVVQSIVVHRSPQEEGQQRLA